MKKRIQIAGILIAISTSVAAGAYFWWPGRDGLAERLVKKGLHGDFAGFTVTRETAYAVKNKPVTEWLATQDRAEMRVLVIENAADSFAQYLDQRVFDVNSQFNRGVSPYPGVVSQQNQCPKEFLPKVETISGPGWEGKKISTFANRRKQFGVCNEQEREFTVQILVFRCLTRPTIFDLTLYSSLAKSDSETFRDLSCP